jgi:hypothetical protein
LFSKSDVVRGRCRTDVHLLTVWTKRRMTGISTRFAGVVRRDARWALVGRSILIQLAV